MTIFQIVNLVVISVIALIVAGLLSLRLEPEAGASLFERTRQIEMKNANARWHKRREAMLGLIISLRMIGAIAATMLAVIIVMLSFSLPLALLLIVLFMGGIIILAHLRFVQQLAETMYQKNERKLVKLLARRTLMGRIVRHISFVSLPPLRNIRVHTRAELISFLKNTAVLSATERKRLRAVLGSESTKLEIIMIPLGELSGLEANDLLGPLRLSELHDTEQHFFPVEERGILVGVIDAPSIFEIDSRSSAQVQSKSARASMTKLAEFPTVYINDSPYDALSVLEGSSHTIAVVYRSSNSPDCVGFVTIGAVLDAILGKTGAVEVV